LAPPSAARAGGNQLRIIAGKWRTRVLQFPDVDGLRPTGNRIRETLFNWLAPHLVGAHCLDAFAGSGALGFEALSRGASSALLLEKDPQAYRFLCANKDSLAAGDATIVNASFFDWLKSSPASLFNVVFLDPPFADNLHLQALQGLRSYNLLAPGALVYLESPASVDLALPPIWRVVKSKASGDVCYQLVSAD
jgi:16S rRNA (guanine966-N2)-methyltransferase